MRRGQGTRDDSTGLTDYDQRRLRKATRFWFTTEASITSANDTGTYHLAELDRARIVVPVAGKRIKAFKKRHEDEPDLESVDDDDDRIGVDGDSERES